MDNNRILNFYGPNSKKVDIFWKFTNIVDYDGVFIKIKKVFWK